MCQFKGFSKFSLCFFAGIAAYHGIPLQELPFEKAIYLVAENESGVVGFLVGGKPKKKDLPYPYEIYIFYVHPDYWRNGIGTALIQAFNERINGSDFCVYMLDGNQRALNFYQKMGGIRYPEYDCDIEINHVMTHDIFLAFAGENKNK